MLVARYEKENLGKIAFVEIRRGASPDKEPSLYVQSNAFPNGLPIGWRLPVSLYNEPKIAELRESIQEWVIENGYTERFRQDVHVES